MGIDPWLHWSAGVCIGMNAPLSSINKDTLWAWSGAESGTDRMRWNNPLNTTLEWGTTPYINANSVGVKVYRTVDEGISATVLTLTNGLYPVIVANLQGSVPRQQWGTEACTELERWGTGCGWLNADYGAAPGVITAEDEDVKVVLYLHALTSDGIYPLFADGTRGAVLSAQAWTEIAGLGVTVKDIADGDLQNIPPAHWLFTSGATGPTKFQGTIG